LDGKFNNTCVVVCVDLCGLLVSVTFVCFYTVQIIHNKVYDVSRFVDAHPGGEIIAEVYIITEGVPCNL
jgi:hypothetical protein